MTERDTSLPPIETTALQVSEIADLIKTDAPVILEIGANSGQHTIGFCETFPNATIHAFEPEPRAIKKWRDRMAPGQATLHETAIGAQNGTVSFHQSGGQYGNTGPENWDQSGSIRAPKVHLEHYPQITFDTCIDVPIRRLDDWAAEHGIGAVDFIWADVQGAEIDLIRGGREVLSRTRYFYTEYNEQEMYEGQLNLSQLAAELPMHRPLRRWNADVLFMNIAEGTPEPS